VKSERGKKKSSVTAEKRKQKAQQNGGNLGEIDCADEKRGEKMERKTQAFFRC